MFYGTLISLKIDRNFLIDLFSDKIKVNYAFIFCDQKLFLEPNSKKSKAEEQNKKDNPKEIFYEFFKLFRKQNKKKNFSSSAKSF